MPDAGDSRATDTTDFDAVRADAVRWLAPSVQHELSNSLGAIGLVADELAKEPRLPHDLRESARLLDAEARRTRGLVTTLLEVTRDRPAVLAPVALDPLLDEVLELLAWYRIDVSIERDPPDGLPPVHADPSRLRQLLVVLLVDALRALGERPRGGSIRIASTLTTDPEAVDLEVAYRRADGAPAADERRLLPSGNRAMGVAGGTLRVERTDASGVLRLAIPIAATEPVDATRPGQAAPAHHAATLATVLVCDDEDAIRALLVRILERDSMRVLDAADGPAALAIIEVTTVDAVLTDQHMAGMSGIELYTAATVTRPELADRFIIMSGEPGADDLVRFATETGVTILDKPFDVHVVAATVRGLVSVGQERDEPADRG
jgi:CheY-like chemotaxis protein